MKLRKVRALLVERGIHQADIARKLGLRPSTVHVVLNGHGKSKRIQQAVADALGLPYEQLWGRKAA